MIKVGFIGYGSMGSMLLEGFISSGGLNPDEVIVSTRTKSKLETIKRQWDLIHIGQDNREVAQKAKYIFICVKQSEVKNILGEIKGATTPATHLISLAGSVSITNIERLITGGVTKITPSIASEVHDGITLICHNQKVTKEDAAYIESLLGRISTVKIINEADLELGIALTSCAPGFIAALFQEFVDASLKYNKGFTKTEIEAMVLQTLLGTARLFLEKDMDFEEVITRVATKGGLTEEGVKVLNAGLPEVFDEMFRETLNKRKKIAEMIDNAYQEKG
ncbi:MAG TPA: pyrroline-5-carboxylate reductase dimerization domain-containing protein [Bacillota bacterium]|nr:pyrroline-5-carboxylate reductase dimerization domain-containing protein [Bacillota bacterium]